MPCYNRPRRAFTERSLKALVQFIRLNHNQPPREGIHFLKDEHGIWFYTISHPSECAKNMAHMLTSRGMLIAVVLDAIVEGKDCKHRNRQIKEVRCAPLGIYFHMIPITHTTTEPDGDRNIIKDKFYLHSDILTQEFRLGLLSVSIPIPTVVLI